MPVIYFVLALAVLVLFGAPLFSIIGTISLLGFSSQGIDTAAIIVEITALPASPSCLPFPCLPFRDIFLQRAKRRSALLHWRKR